MYKIRLQNFEGPLDLLLYFIKRDEINIYDIPIARVTKEFLQYVRLMRALDLELAGEFVLMAATLTYIKSQMLLPRAKSDDDEEIEDPRTQLVRQLLEYKRFKEAAKNLSQNEEKTKYVYYRKSFDSEVNSISSGGVYRNASLFNLMRALKKALDKKPEIQKHHTVQLIPVSVEEAQKKIIERLREHVKTSFFKLTAGETKQNIVVIFIALLELIKSNKIIFRQSELFDDIAIALKPDLN